MVSQGLFPGDIQKVRAVPRKNFTPFTFLDEVLVFSAKGDRPLGDMLGGGDLDGDEYFVVYEPQIVDVVITTKAHNYKTQNFSTPNTSPSISVSSENQSVLAPISIARQLAALKQFITNGNLVADSADAWIRVADMNGVVHEEAQRVANLHQQALDSRKQACSIDRVKINHILETIPRPHYKVIELDVCAKLSV